jgi:hypothetical protein
MGIRDESDRLVRALGFDGPFIAGDQYTPNFKQ